MQDLMPSVISIIKAIVSRTLGGCGMLFLFCRYDDLCKIMPQRLQALMSLLP